MPIEKSSLPDQAILTAAKCSATLPIRGTTIRPMKTVEIPVSSMVGSMAPTSTSDRTPVAIAEADSITSDRRVDQRAPSPPTPVASGDWKDEYR